MRYSVLSLLLAGVAQAQEPREFLERHCFECHAPDSRKAFKLDVATWIKIYDRVAAGEMPPKQKVDSAAFLKTLGAWLTRESRQEPARFRRLNRAEYENTLRDLLGLQTLSIQVLLPEDGRAHGFTKVGSALDLSHVQLARYMEIAELALNQATALRTDDPPPTKIRFSVPANFGEAFWRGDTIFITKDRKWNRDYPGPQTTPADYDVKMTRVADCTDTVGVMRPEFYKFPYKFWTGYRKIVAAPAPGWYRVRLSVWSFLYDKGEIKPAPRPQVALLRAGPRQAGYIDVPSWEPAVREVEMWLDKGELPGFSAHSIVFDQPHSGLPGLVKQTKPGIAIDWAEMEGPIVKGTPRPVLDDLERFARRAFRRPVTSAELDRYRKMGKDATKAILCSPDFLFIRDSALASRLSFFLWNSMPDDAPIRADLREQVEAMLRDPRSERFIEDFTDQWLELRDIDATCPDTNLYPEFSTYLKDCMVGESRAFFRELVRADRPVTEIVQSDWAMLNQGIAEFYGIPNVHGSAYRKVTLPPGTHRGGVLTQAAVLKVTANGTTTTPVKRGAWVLNNILNRPPDPPPADVPAVEPDIRGATTIREQLAKHRSQPACAGCHAKIDPPGMALESFDVMGGWRTRYRSVGSGDPSSAMGFKGRPITFYLSKPVDPSGELADKSPFRDIDDLKKHLARDPDRLARAMAEKLLVYATGAPLDFADRAAVDEIVRRVRTKGYGFRSLIHEVVASPTFRSK
jgi:hypothetical protein